MQCSGKEKHREIVSEEDLNEQPLNMKKKGR